MKHQIIIGVVCLVRDTFDHKAAGELYAKTMEQLSQRKDVVWQFVSKPIMSKHEAETAGRWIAQQHVDGLVLISGTFHLGHLAMVINNLVQKPVLLWGYNELPYNGGKIRLNAVCGVNLNASNLYKSGCDTYACHIGETIDDAWLDALKMKAAIANAHVGIAGYRADGFFNLSVEDTALFAKTGALIDHYELQDLMAPVDDPPDYNEADVCGIYDCSGITQTQVEKVAALTNAMERFLTENKLDALAVRCWPEFANSFGTSPCAAMSILNARGYTIGCEGDVEGTISMLACNAVAQDPAFLADLSQVNVEKDYALMWHCGVAPYTLWDKKSVRSLDTYFAGGRGVTADFVMKSGPVTIMRIDSARGKTRVFLAQGTAVPMEKELKGTYCKVRFTKPVADLLDTVTKTGVAHHVSMMYGDYSKAVRKFAEMMGFACIE